MDVTPTSSTSSTSSSTTATSTAASEVSNGRYWGLASGLDVDSIVTALVSDMQSKIDKANQQKQTVEWQQTAYQNVVSSLNTFNSTYLSFSGAGNILTSNVYTAYQATSDNTAVSATANSDAASGQHALTVYQSAAAGSITGSQVGAVITGAQNATLAQLDGTSFNITVDGVTKSISLSASDSYTGSDGKQHNDVAGVLQSKINTALGINKVSVTADATTGDISISSNPSYQSAISVSSGPTAITGSRDLSTSTTDDYKAILSGTSFNMTVGGQTQTISFDDSDFDGDSFNFTSMLQGKLDTAFGKDGSGKSLVNVSVNSAGDISFQSGSASGASVEVSDPSSGPLKSSLGAFGVTSGASLGDTLGALGITNGAGNRLNLSSTLSSLFGGSINANSDGSFAVTINGVNIALNTNDTLTQAFSAINASAAGVTASYSANSGEISLTSSTTGASTTITNSDSYTNSGGQNTASGFFNAIFAGSGTAAQGKDVIFNLDGTNYTRSSNNFTMDGVTYSVNKKIDQNVPNSAQTANINLTNNVSTGVTAITNFVNAYNTLITNLNTQVNTKPDSNYPPLTSEQESQMSSTDIANWNAQAQAGIIFNDPTVTSILTQMRNMLYQPVATADGGSISLYQVGVTVSDDPTAGGMLEIDPDKLTAALENNAGDVQQLFTKTSSTFYHMGGSNQAQRQSDEGLAYRLQDIINSATSTGVYPYVGSLISIAGTPSDNSTNYSLNEELQQISTSITDYTQQMTDKKNTLYNQFTTLETYMQQMNSQSSMLASFGSGSGS